MERNPAAGPLRIAGVGHVVFAATMIALGILGLVKGDFATIWGGVPKGLPAREALAYLCAVVSLACGVGLVWRRTSAVAARVLFGYLLLWLLLVKGRYVVLAPAVEVVYQNCGETAVIVAGAWVLYAWFATDWDRRWLGFATGARGVRMARVLFALALIAFGLSHFFYLYLTAPLVPKWLPWHVGWAYCTGSAYLAAAAAVLVGMYARLAATLAAVQMGGFTLLVWVPRVTSGHLHAVTGSSWDEFAVSWMLTTAAWVLADSYRGIPWFAVDKR